MAHNGVGYMHRVCRYKLFIPVSQEGTDDILCVFGDLHFIWEVQRVLVVHDLTVGSNQRVGVERRVT